MLNLISCEVSKLKRSKMVLISMAGVLSTPLLMLIQVLQTHFDKPDIAFTLADVYSDSILYTMLLANMMVYVAIAAFLFSREYAESTLKTILPIPISRTKLLIGKFFYLTALDHDTHFCNMVRYFYRLWAISRCLYALGI